MNNTRDPSLSLVITAYTTERLCDIYELLVSVKNQTYKNMETIFVIERSRELLDGINTFVGEKTIPNIKTVFSLDRLGLSRARNLGIKHAKGKIIGFVDDDVVLYPDWAEEMVKALENDSAIGVTGSAFPLWENKSLKWLPEKFYWLISCTAWTGWQEQRIIRGVFGANMAFKKEAFDGGCMFAPNAGYTGGFHHQPIPDDLEFSLRIRKRTGKSIIFSPETRVWHRVSEHRLSLRFIAARSHQIGCTRRMFKDYYSHELGPFDQENQVLKSTFRLFMGLPKEFFTKPSLAWKKLSLISTVLIFTAIGYLVPVSLSFPVKQKGISTN